jgi:centrosomal protein CEP164
MAATNRIVELTQHETYDPTEAEVEEYADFLGVDIEYERDFFPLARAGLVAALPENWIPCKVEETEDYFYFNKQSGESIWDHPLDDVYRQLVVEARQKRRCYVVSLELLQDDAESKIQGTNLAGDILYVQVATRDESFGDVEDKLRSTIVVDDSRVLCFALPNAKLIGFSSRSKSVEDVFKQD